MIRWKVFPAARDESKNAAKIEMAICESELRFIGNTPDWELLNRNRGGELLVAFTKVLNYSILFSLQDIHE